MYKALSVFDSLFSSRLFSLSCLCCVQEITARLHALILLHRRLEKGKKGKEKKKKNNPGEYKMPFYFYSHSPLLLLSPV